MESEAGGRSCSPKAFHRLRDLPPEIRQYIWSLARPRRRVISLYLGRAHFNQSIITRTSTPVSVPTILHVCHESREVAKGIYQQGLGNDTVTWDIFWWDPRVDILYLSPLPNWREMPVVHDNDSDQEDEEDEIAELPSLSLSAGIGQVRIYNLLSQVEHLAIPVDFAIAMGLTAPLDNVDDSDEGPMIALLVWIQRFPSLKSLNLLIDPFCDWSQERKIVLLHEPLDVANRALFGLSPSKMEQVAAERFLEWKKQNNLDWEPPSVKVHVIGFWRGRNIKFCVPKATSPI